MRGKKIGRIDATQGGDSFYSDTGQALGFYAVFSGSNATGETGTAQDLGRLIVTRNGNPVHNIKIADLQRVMNTRSGISILDSTTGGTFEASAFLPNFEETFPSAMNIRKTDELSIEWQPPGGGVIGTRFDSLDIEFFMREAAIPERRGYGLSSKTFNYGAAVDNDPNALGQPNITSIYIDDPSSILDTISVEQDGRTEQDAVDPLYLRAVTLQENQIEDSTFDFPKLPLYTPGERGTLRSGNTSVTLSVTGAGNVNIVMGRIL